MTANDGEKTYCRACTIRALLRRLHARLGDYWWYSLMIFTACRAADLLNAIVGLWIVPKYVATDELGALMPLMQFANMLAIPATVFAATFRNELTTLAVNRKFGQMKSLMRGVFIASAVFLFVAMVVCRFVLPSFLSHIRIVRGSLGIIIIGAAFVSAVAPVYNNALQALKMFKSISVLNIISAPIRLVTMLVAMPFRPLSGYVVGQTSTPVFQIVASLFCLRKPLSVRAEPYWKRETVKRFAWLFAMLAAGSLSGSFATLIENTVLRHNLPALDSAGYYMVTRFSDIPGFLAMSLTFTLFPFAAEMDAKGRDPRPLMLKICLALTVFNVAFAGVFAVCGKWILAILPHGEKYAEYWWAIPFVVLTAMMTNMVSIYATAEVAANRFGYYKWMLPLTLAYPILLSTAAESGPLAVSSLKNMLWWMAAFAALKLACVAAAMMRPPRTTTASSP